MMMMMTCPTRPYPKLMIIRNQNHLIFRGGTPAFTQNPIHTKNSPNATRRAAIRVETTEEGDDGETESEDAGSLEAGGKSKKRSVSDLARESYETLLESNKRMKKLEDKMDKALEKFLSM